jgi:glycosyltransferase involved in cell wall biosynthesis
MSPSAVAFPSASSRGTRPPDVSSPSRAALAAVVALAGARDRHQLPLALYERGLLTRLVTDLFWPTRHRLANTVLQTMLDAKQLAKRGCHGLDPAAVRLSLPALAAFAGTKCWPRVHALNARKGRSIGSLTRRLALRSEAAALCYTSYAFEAFRDDRARPAHRILFALQADPRSRRSIMQDEMDRRPEAADTLREEHEFSLSPKEFERLACEPHLATGILASSTYAASTLIAQGVARDRIRVVPYGVDASMFPERPRPPQRRKPFRIAYVGRMTQSKGLLDLFDAARLLQSRIVEVQLFAHTNAGHELCRPYGDLRLRTNIGLSGQALATALQACDVLVLPSLAEGFGHVVLEAMSCGVPVVATTNTCGPDVVTNKVDGFIVPIRDPEAIASRLSWAIDHRDDLAAMGAAAARKARQFTWERFRARVANAYLALRSVTG